MQSHLLAVGLSISTLATPDGNSAPWPAISHSSVRTLGHLSPRRIATGTAADQRVGPTVDFTRAPSHSTVIRSGVELRLTIFTRARVSSSFRRSTGLGRRNSRSWFLPIIARCSSATLNPGIRSEAALRVCRRAKGSWLRHHQHSRAL